MGLIRAGVGAVKSVIADQWKELFECKSIPTGVLMTKGVKKTNSAFGTKNNGNDNVISNGSSIIVHKGQCMVIIDNGAIVEFCAEEGEFVYDTSTEPSLLHGNLGENIAKTFATIGRRFTFGGDTARSQYVYYFNTKEIIGNLFGTPNPVPFRVVDKNIGLDMDIAIRCNGEYSFKIVNPLLFFENVAGNVVDQYRTEEITGQMKAEFLTALQPGFARLSEMGIRYSAIAAHTMELAEAMNQILSPKWGEIRGIEVVSVGINSVSASPEDEEMIKKMQKDAVYRDPNMAGARLTVGQTDAMNIAAGNSAGAMLGFAGMNLAANAGGMNANQLFAMGQQQAQQQAAMAAQQAPQVQESVQASNEGRTIDEQVKEAAKQVHEAAANANPAASWKCECGTTNMGNFCVECGTPKPTAPAGWTCSCGALNKGKFCMECGTKKPADAPLYRCDKCGWEPEDPKNPPKFCPECGDAFDENDVQ